MPKRPRDEDEGFEVVDDDVRPRPKKKRPAAETRDMRMADTDEVPRRPAKRARVEEDDEDRPARRRPRAEADEDDDRPARRRRDEDDEDDDRPRKNKKPRLTAADRKRMKREDDEARDAKREEAVREWAVPIFLTFIGVIMTTVAGVIMARRSEGLISPPLLLAVTTAWTLFLVPVVIVSLMVIGGIAGIDYGTLKNAVRSLVAITFVVNGIYWLGNLSILGWFLAPMIAGLVTFALFMVFFSLDPQETSTSLGVLNLILWLANMAFKMFIIAMLVGGFSRKARDMDDNPRFQNQGRFDGRNDRDPPDRFGDDDDN